MAFFWSFYAFGALCNTGNRMDGSGRCRHRNAGCKQLDPARSAHNHYVSVVRSTSSLVMKDIYSGGLLAWFTEKHVFSSGSQVCRGFFGRVFSVFRCRFSFLSVASCPSFPPASPAVSFLSFVAGVAALLGLDADVNLPHLSVGDMKILIADAVANVADSFCLAHVSGFLELCLLLLLPVPSPPAPLAFSPMSPLSPLATLPSLAFLPLSLPLLLLFPEVPSLRCRRSAPRTPLGSTNERPRTRPCCTCCRRLDCRSRWRRGPVLRGSSRSSHRVGFRPGSCRSCYSGAQGLPERHGGVDER